MKKNENGEAKMKKINAFIVSTNGNIYETSAWSAAEPILTYYQNQRDSYWARAKKEWRNFAYWALLIILVYFTRIFLLKFII